MQVSNVDNLTGKPDLRVLEVGFGAKPSWLSGEIYERPDVNYCGLELPREAPNGISFRIPRIEATFDFPIIEADMNQMPFSTESFDFVLLRSVYGQLKMSELGGDQLFGIRTGIRDISRVLRTGGCVVVAEENTPMDVDYIKRELVTAGLRVLVQAMMKHQWSKTPDDDPWRCARNPFYTDAPWNGLGRGWNIPSHITYAQK